MAVMGISTFLLLGVVAGLAHGEYSPEICDFVRESCGPAIPILPRNFELKGEHIDFDNNFTVYEEMYFDYISSRGKYMYLLNGIERHFLFDYEVSQVLRYDVFHPGVDSKRDPMSKECIVESMEDSEYKFIFGYIDEFTNHPKMYTSYEALRFGGPYRYSANGTEVLQNRGVPVNRFTGCVYDNSMDITMAANYSFTGQTVVTAGGTLEKEVTGADNGVLSVPVKIEMRGAMAPGDGGDPKLFNRVESFFWFKGEPEFKLRTFQIPPWMHCEGFLGRLDMPPLPTAFTTRLQVTSFSVDILGEITTTEISSYEHLFYYKEKKLARRDYTPSENLDTEIKNKFGSLTPVRTVYDFNEGLLYVTNKASGRCFIRPIVHGDYFETPRNSLFTEMATPEELFKMHTEEMEYKGTHFARDIDCDVFNGKYFDKDYNATFLMETYFSTNGWHEDADEIVEYGVPVRHTIIQKELDFELSEGVSNYDFLKFKTKTPRLVSFDVSNCIETTDHKDFALLLDLSPTARATVSNYKYQVLETAQYYLTEISQVMTPLRVQRMQMRRMSPSDNREFLMFTLVDKIKLKTQVAVGQKGASLAEASVFLQKFVDTGRFVLQFITPGTTDTTLIPATPGGLYVRTSSGDLQLAQFFDVTTLVKQKENMVIAEQMFGESDIEEKEDKGMSSGGLAGLSIAMLFIGLGIGIAIMYLYIRYYSEKQLEERIVLSTQRSQEDA